MTALNDREKWALPHEPRGFADVIGPQQGDPFAEFDLLGRKQPRRLGMPDYLLMVARIEPGRVRRVPAPAVAEEGVDDEGEFSMVTCPCGAHPMVRSALAKCAGCERHYVAIELGVVYVCYGAMTPPPLS